MTTDPVSSDGSDTFTVRVSPDRHFRVKGAINGTPVVFLVDTGASLVAMSKAVAAKAKLHGGRKASFETAAGAMPGRIVDAVPVTVGPFTVPQATVAIGISSPSGEVLLGQSFLSQFEITLTESEMTIHNWKK